MSDKTIDLCGLKCPLPGLPTRKLLAGMASGGVMVINVPAR